MLYLTRNTEAQHSLSTLHGDTSQSLYKIFSWIPAKNSCCDLDESGTETVKKSPNYPLTAHILSHTSICGHQSGSLVSNLSFYPDLSNLGASCRPAPSTAALVSPAHLARCQVYLYRGCTAPCLLIRDAQGSVLVLCEWVFSLMCSGSCRR